MPPGARRRCRVPGPTPGSGWPRRARAAPGAWRLDAQRWVAVFQCPADGSDQAVVIEPVERPDRLGPRPGFPARVADQSRYERAGLLERERADRLQRGQRHGVRGDLEEVRKHRPQRNDRILGRSRWQRSPQANHAGQGPAGSAQAARTCNASTRIGTGMSLLAASAARVEAVLGALPCGRSR